jgi:hypothetical protein
MDAARKSAYARLADFLPRAMEDGLLDEEEKQELVGLLASGTLHKEDVQEIFSGYLSALASEVWADGSLTETKRERCRQVVKALRIPDAFLPAEMAALLRG